MDHGHHEKALRTLARLHSSGDVSNAFVMKEFEAIKLSIEYEHAHEAKSYFELFTSKSAFRRLVLCCAIQASIQMTGVAGIQYYAPEIYAHIGKRFPTSTMCLRRLNLVPIAWQVLNPS